MNKSEKNNILREKERIKVRNRKEMIFYVFGFVCVCV